MFELLISYNNESGRRRVRAFTTIMDFVYDVEACGIDVPKMEYTDVNAEFFEHHKKHFDTIRGLYNHCRMIVGYPTNNDSKKELKIDVYDKMAEFLVKNHLNNCDMCKAIDMNGNNSCCDNDKWCIDGTAAYLRDNKVLQIDE